MAAQTKSKCEKFRILQRIIYKVSEEKINNSTRKDLNVSDLELAVKYTGLHEMVLTELSRVNSFEVKVRDVDRLPIYFELVNFYLTKKSIPTTRILFNSLYKKIPSYLDIAEFRKLLVKMDFVWKKSQYGSTFVIERPEVVIERYNYLKNILEYRQNNKDIYYVDENAIEATCGYLSLEQSNRLAKKAPSVNQRRVIYAVSKTGIVSMKFVSNFDTETFENWIIEDLLPVITTSSVIVYNNAKHHCRKISETPTLDSLKIEMTEWLKRNGVPFESEMSKYELFSLIEKCTDINENMYNIDRIIQIYGHLVLRLPNSIKNITPANLLNQIIGKNVKQIIFKDTNTWHEDVIENFNELVECIPDIKFIQLTDNIIKHENIINQSDKAVDSVLDDLLDKISRSQLNDENDSDIPSCSESE